MERNVVKRIIAALTKTFGGLWWKTHGGPFQRSGKGDILGCCQGFYFNIEVKQDKKGKKYEPTELQKREIKKVQKNGGCAGCVKNPQQALDLVGSHLKQKANEASAKSNKEDNKVRIIRIMDGSRYWENPNSSKDGGKSIQKRKDKKRSNPRS